jgi:hypothetical protein
MATKTHYLIFSSESAFDLGVALALLPTVEAKLSTGGVMRPGRVEAAGGETRVYFGPRPVRVAAAPLAEAVPVLHKAIQLDEYPEADRFVHKPGHALRVWLEQEEGEFGWTVSPDPVYPDDYWDRLAAGLLSDAEVEDPPHVAVIEADWALCYALVDRFPPAVSVLMGGVDPDGVRLCVPSEPRVSDWG